MQNIITKFRIYEALEAHFDAVDAAWEADPENESIEATWDEAYADIHAAGEAVAAEIVKFTAGVIDTKTARRMLTEKREELEKLISKAA